jgi:HSP20 family protein
MAKTEITTPAQPNPGRQRDVLFAMRDEMDRIFERFENGWSRLPALMRREGAITVPELDMHENTNAIVVEAELPGVEEHDVTVTLANGVLTIRGEKRHEREDRSQNYHMAERSYGNFERSIRLPESVDDARVDAKFDKGVLRVTAAKRPEAVRAERRIEVRRA